MIPEKRFSRWAAIGVPLFVAIGIGGTVVIHLGFDVPYEQLNVPIGLYVGLQIVSYLCAFWVGKWAREDKRYWPMPLLCGLYLWGTGMMIIHYGIKWGILPNTGDCGSFSIIMAALLAMAWPLSVKYGRKLIKGISPE